MPPKIDLTGQRVNRLTVLREAGRDGSAGRTRVMWLCRCDCGTLVRKHAGKLRDGRATSCGCLQRDKLNANNPRPRFWAKVDKSGPIPEHVPGLGNCWVWTGKLREWGYGHYAVDGFPTKFTHRISWFFAHGEWPASMLSVCHKCDNPACVNPEHLFLGSQADNNRDCESKGRRPHPSGSGVATSRLTEETVVKLRNARREGRLHSTLAARALGVSAATIKWAVNGRTWSHLPGAVRGKPKRTTAGRYYR